MVMADIDIQGQADKLRDQKKDKKRFLLSEPEWHSVQAYCAAVMALPTTDSEIKIKLALTKNDNVADFKDLRDRYVLMYQHVQDWDTKTMPKSIDVATHVKKYGNNAKIYYGEMLKLAEAGLDKGTNKKDFLEIVDNRAKEAQKFAKEAAEVAEGVRKFHQQTNEDIGKMATLKGDYDKKYSSSNKKWQDADKKIKELQEQLKQANEAYEHACIVAGTTPTYAWVTILGFIAAVTVASIYGSEAVKLKNLIKDIEKEINDLQGELTRNTHIRASVKCALDSVTHVKEKADHAVNTLAKMRGGWESIATSLKDLAELVGKDLKEAEGLVKLQVKQAIADWESVAAEAADYTQNAYINKPSQMEMMVAA
jgi:uncharacterized protein YukE